MWTCQKHPPWALPQCLFQAWKHLLHKPPLRGSTEKVSTLLSTLSACVESAVEQAEAVERWTNSRVRPLELILMRGMLNQWGECESGEAGEHYQLALLLMHSCRFSCVSFLKLVVPSSSPATFVDVAALSWFQECQQNDQRGSLQSECWGCIFSSVGCTHAWVIHSHCRNNWKTLSFFISLDCLYFCWPQMPHTNILHYPAAIPPKCLVTFFKYTTGMAGSLNLNVSIFAWACKPTTLQASHLTGEGRAVAWRGQRVFLKVWRHSCTVWITSK